MPWSYNIRGRACLRAGRLGQCHMLLACAACEPRAAGHVDVHKLHDCVRSYLAGDCHGSSSDKQTQK